MTIVVRTLDPAAVEARLADLSRLRITVFREWPYLYDGDPTYESGYLATFARAPNAVLVAAFDGDAVIGMATASPMAAQAPEVREPLSADGHDVDQLFYFGESVLLPQYRGHGIGHRFFDHREAGARRAGAHAAVFCAIDRPITHPLHPPQARSHASFWTRRGYREIPGAACTMHWPDIGDADESAHTLQYWIRAL